jgi:hypothetical protein
MQKIFLFGFSRGAHTAQVTADFIVRTDYPFMTLAYPHNLGRYRPPWQRRHELLCGYIPGLAEAGLAEKEIFEKPNTFGPLPTYISLMAQTEYISRMAEKDPTEN